MENNITIFDHPLITHKISILRDVNTGSKQFRELVEEIATLMGYEALRDLPTESDQDVPYQTGGAVDDDVLQHTQFCTSFSENLLSDQFLP